MTVKTNRKLVLCHVEGSDKVVFDDFVVHVFPFRYSTTKDIGEATSFLWWSPLRLLHRFLAETRLTMSFEFKKLVGGW